MMRLAASTAKAGASTTQHPREIVVNSREVAKTADADVAQWTFGLT